MMYIIDDLRFSVMTYIFATKDYSWGNEIIMEEIEMKWVFRVGSEKHEADNRVIVNPTWEASGKWGKFDGRKSWEGWEIRRYVEDVERSGLVMPTRK